MQTAIAAGPLLSWGHYTKRPTVVLIAALAFGNLTQALFWSTGIGLNFFLWTLLSIGACFAARGEARLSPVACGAVVAAVVLSFSIVLYASRWTLAIALPATVVILAALPMLLRKSITLADVARVPISEAFGPVLRVPVATPAALRLMGSAFGERGSSMAVASLRGLLLGVPIAAVFALLLGSDLDFAVTLAHLRDRLGESARFVVLTFATSVAYVAVHAVEPRQAPRNDLGPVGAPREKRRWRLGWLLSLGARPDSRGPAIALAMVLAQVVALFGIFVVANLRHLFGGHAFVREPGSPTYASYLHAGFAQLLVATVLSVCLVLGGHALLKRRCSSVDGRVPGGVALMSLEGSLLFLSGVTVVSCWQRLGIYEDAYGATQLRLGVAFIELAIFGVLALTAVKVVARGWNGYGGSILALFTAVAVVACGINADLYIATTNLERAARGRSLDVEYIASLSADACQILESPMVRRDAALLSTLESRFLHPAESPGLRAFRGLGRCNADVSKGVGR